MWIFLAPIYALFSVDFYKMILRQTVWKGVQYMLYLTLLSTILFTLIFSFQAIPAIERFVGWFQTEMPVLTITDQGVLINEQNPYSMVHPALGTVVTFDTTRTEIAPDEMIDVLLYVTATKLYVRQNDGVIRVYDIPDAVRESGASAMDPMIVTPESIYLFFEQIKPWLIALSALIFFAMFFAWKMLVALFYSWVGLLLNFARKEPLSFGAIYNVVLFAMTAAILWQGLRLVIPALAIMPGAVLVGIVMTGFYLHLGILRTQEPVDDHPDVSEV